MRPHDWYVRHCSRLEAEERLLEIDPVTKRHLQPDGAFLLRQSEADGKGFSLSVKDGSQVLHFKILQDDNGKYFVWLSKFDSINQLIEHHRTTTISRGGTLLLVDRVPSKLCFSTGLLRALAALSMKERLVGRYVGVSVCERHSTSLERSAFTGKPLPAIDHESSISSCLMLEQSESCLDNSLIDKSASRPSDSFVIGRQKEGRKRRRVKKRAFHKPVTVSSDDSFAMIVPKEPHAQYSRVLFDECGNLLSAISMCPTLRDTCNRKSKKRAGCFDMKRLSAVTDSDDQAYVFVPDTSAASSAERTALPHCPEVLVQHVKDHNLEVNVYKFPHDYASVVKYWYFNLDQLNRLDQSISQQTTACSIGRQKEGRKRRRVKKRAFHKPVTVSSDDSFAMIVPKEPHAQYSRVLFDECGNLLSAISMCPTLRDTCNRKSKKRAGCFDMKRLSAVTDSDDQAYVFVPDTSAASSAERTALPHCPEVLVQHVKDHNLEVNVYKFPHDYASVVKYWYFNLDQLNRLDQSISQQTTACSTDYVPTDSIEPNQHNVDQSCLSSPHPEHSPSGSMTFASNSTDYVPTDSIEPNQHNVDQSCLSSPHPEHSPSGSMTFASNSTTTENSNQLEIPDVKVVNK
ncbi:hypothetical protein AHF37_02947 [Paragonimus kellicotti]|nr:hypothetical protein AHF37_02947 [Paragonimus kellicotti]